MPLTLIIGRRAAATRVGCQRSRAGVGRIWSDFPTLGGYSERWRARNLVKMATVGAAWRCDALGLALAAFRSDGVARAATPQCDGACMPNAPFATIVADWGLSAELVDHRRASDTFISRSGFHQEENPQNWSAFAGQAIRSNGSQDFIERGERASSICHCHCFRWIAIRDHRGAIATVEAMGAF